VYPVFEWSKEKTRLTQEVAAKRTRKRQRVLVAKRLLLGGDIPVNNKNQHGVSTQEQQHHHQPQLDHDNLEPPSASGEHEHLLQQYGDRDDEGDRNNRGKKSQNTEPDHGTENAHEYNRNIQYDDNPPPRLAKMFLWDTITELVGGYEQEWMVIQVSYTVFRKTDRPILERLALQNITDICYSVLNATITSGHFLDYLQNLIHEGEDADDQDASQDSQDGVNGITPWNPYDGE
jgi:hypothetical protein